MKVLAFDFGASSGRAIVFELKDKKLTQYEVHRFDNDPVMLGSDFYWDVLRLFHEIKAGLLKCKNEGHKIDAIGIDTWGVDYALLDENDKLIANPHSYRDARTQSVKFSEKEKREIFDVAGIQESFVNSLFQFICETKEPVYGIAKTALFIPDFFNFLLTGEKKCEYTIASTSQMLDAKKRKFDDGIMSRFGIKNIFPEIVEPGTKVGYLTDALCEELGVDKVPVIAVGSHDTASAVASAPMKDSEHTMFISCGTWLLVGAETKEPIINDLSYKYNYTNEGGVFKTYRFLHNVMGMWLQMECKRTWVKNGDTVSFKDLDIEAENLEPFTCLLNPNYPEFESPGNMPKRIHDYAVRTNQTPPESKAATIRAILESLALECRRSLECLEEMLGRKLKYINIVGGGSKSFLLCQFLANACGTTVISGPVEGTGIGNALMQFVSLGQIKDLAEARQIVENSVETTVYEPRDTKLWNEAYEKYLKILENE